MNKISFQGRYSFITNTLQQSAILTDELKKPAKQLSEGLDFAADVYSPGSKKTQVVLRTSLPQGSPLDKSIILTAIKNLKKTGENSTAEIASNSLKQYSK